MAPSSPQNKVKYQPLASGEIETSTLSLAKSHSFSSRAAMMIVPVVVTFTIALILGWVAGQHFPEKKWDGLIPPPGNVAVVFEHDLLYSERPTPESEAAWNSLIPAIEEADVARGGQRPDDFLKETGTRMAQSHVRHCFDYIRQTLMCGADTSLEVLDRETRATSGWGQRRQCRSYHEVFEWAEKWANSTDTGILS
ncbi:hypothetical protein N7486_000064 [Penicillium sp. IBT 16267x]|nr:hypothetical protein N7486_000064 [Penicillium sp. IBT 16267x]